MKISPPVQRVLDSADHAVRELRRSDWQCAETSATALAMQLTLAALIYGGCMGTFRATLGADGALLQILYSALKTPLMLVGATLLTIPCVYVASSLLGLRREFGPALRNFLVGQAALATVLLALAPVVLLGYASTPDHRQALLFNAIAFAIASLAGQALLRRRFRALPAPPAKRRALLAVWLIVYWLVAIQLAWRMRPFVGSADLPVTFFRTQSGDDNAYVQAFKLLGSLFN